MALIPAWFPRGAYVKGDPNPGAGPAGEVYCPTLTAGLPDSISQITISVWGSHGDIGIRSIDTTAGVGSSGFTCQFGVGGGGPGVSPPYTGSAIVDATNNGTGAPFTRLAQFCVYNAVATTAYNETAGNISYTSGLYSHFLVCIDFIASTVTGYYNDAPFAFNPGQSQGWGASQALNNRNCRWGFWPPAYVGEIWLAPVKVDMSVLANRRQFINANLSPVQLPNDGTVSFDTGSVRPGIFMRATPWQLGTDAYGTPSVPSPAHPISEFLTNRGTGAPWVGTVVGETMADYGGSGTVMFAPSTNNSSGQTDLGAFAGGNADNQFQLVTITGTGWGPPKTITSTTDLGFPATFRYALFSIYFKSIGPTSPAFSWVSTTGSGGLRVDVDLSSYDTDLPDAVVTIAAYNNATEIVRATVPFDYTGYAGNQGQSIIVAIDTVGQLLQCFIGGTQRVASVAWSAALPMTKAPAMKLDAWSGSEQCIGELYYSDTNSFYDLNLGPLLGGVNAGPHLLAFLWPPNPSNHNYNSRPKAMGSNGQGPTNVVPRVFLRVASNETNGVNWAANLGTGGAFAPAPPLCASPTFPDPPTASLAMDDVVVTAEAGLSSNLIWLSYSDDRGHSWSNPISQPFGAAGEYDRSLQWNRLGYARDRAFRLEWSVPAPTALQGAWITAQPGDGKGS